MHKCFHSVSRIIYTAGVFMRLGTIFRKLFDRWVETSQIQAPNHISGTVPNIPSPPSTPNSSSGIALAQNSLRISEDLARELLNPTGEVRRRSDGQMSDAAYSRYIAGISGEGNRRSDGHVMGSMDYRAMQEYRAEQTRRNFREFDSEYQLGLYDEYRTSTPRTQSINEELSRVRLGAMKLTTENLALKEKVSQLESEIAILRSRVRGEVHGIRDLDIKGDIV